MQMSASDRHTTIDMSTTRECSYLNNHGLHSYGLRSHGLLVLTASVLHYVRAWACTWMGTCMFAKPEGRTGVQPDMCTSHVCMRACVCASGRKGAGAFVCISVHVCMHASVLAHICPSVRACVCMRVFAHTSMMLSYSVSDTLSTAY